MNPEVSTTVAASTRDPLEASSIVEGLKISRVHAGFQWIYTLFLIAVVATPQSTEAILEKEAETVIHNSDKTGRPTYSAISVYWPNWPSTIKAIAA